MVSAACYLGNRQFSVEAAPGGRPAPVYAAVARKP
jgi:hypothetical protein